MQLKEDDQYPVVKTLTETNPEPIIDSVGGGVTYYGYAPLGTKITDPSWKIKKVVVVVGLTTTLYADGDMKYDNVWNDRTSLSYAR